MIAGGADAAGQSGNTIGVRAQFLNTVDDGHGDCAGGTGYHLPLPSAPAISTRGRWRQSDVKRAIGAAEQAGLQHYRIEIAPDGTLAIVVGASSPEGSEVVAARG